MRITPRVCIPCGVSFRAFALLSYSNLDYITDIKQNQFASSQFIGPVGCSLAWAAIRPLK